MIGNFTRLILQVFEHSLHKSLPDTNLAKRLRNISETHTYNLYNYGCTGIFEKHKLLFSFQITLKLKIDEGLVSDACRLRRAVF